MLLLIVRDTLISTRNWIRSSGFARNLSGWITDNHGARLYVMHDHCSRTDYRTHADNHAWPDVSFSCYPSVFANFHWSCYKRKSRLSMIVRCSTKKGSLTDNRITPQHDPIDAVAINAGCKTTASFHHQVPWRPNAGRGIRMRPFADFSAKKAEQEPPPPKERRRRRSKEQRPHDQP
jgi:hypothetical protein